MSGFPSPSKSAMTVANGSLPVLVVRLKLVGKQLVLMLGSPPLNVGSNSWLELATKPFTVTVMAAKVAPGGTFTIKVFRLAATTVARTAPKYTMFDVVLGLKWLPLMVTVVPMEAEAGIKPDMVGTPGKSWFVVYPADIICMPEMRA